MKHPAVSIPFAELQADLEQMVAEKYVNRQVSHDGLHIYSYSDSCTYDKRWNRATLVARGLIIDPNDNRIVALPFPKFFNVGENQSALPALPFETFEKMDGSLIIIFAHGGEWRTATRGSFQSDQAKWAADHLKHLNLTMLDESVTYLAEAIYPQNKIVVHYQTEGLFLLGAYRADGAEYSYQELQNIASDTGMEIAKRYEYDSISDLLSRAKTLSADEEGWVVRFENGHRVKVKGEEYLRIHRLVSRLTPLAVWEALMNGDNLDLLRRELPEEFWVDFDAIRGTLELQVAAIVEQTKHEAGAIENLSDKEVGLRLDTFPKLVRSLIFPYRKQNGDLLTGRSRGALFRMIRPTGNILEGYTPSYLLNRVIEEAA